MILSTFKKHLKGGVFLLQSSIYTWVNLQKMISGIYTVRVLYKTWVKLKLPSWFSGLGPFKSDRKLTPMSTVRNCTFRFKYCKGVTLGAFKSGPACAPSSKKLVWTCFLVKSLKIWSPNCYYILKSSQWLVYGLFLRLKWMGWGEEALKDQVGKNISQIVEKSKGDLLCVVWLQGKSLN